MKNDKFIFSGRARARFSSYYLEAFAAAIDLLKKSERGKLSIGNIEESELNTAKKKTVIPDQYFINLFDLLARNKQLFEECSIHSINRFILAMNAQKTPSTNVIGRAFNHRDANHDFRNNPPTKGEIKPNPPAFAMANFFSLVLTRMELDEWAAEGFADGLAFEEDCFVIVDNQPKVDENKRTHDLTMIPNLEDGQNTLPRLHYQKLIESQITNGRRKIQIAGIGGIGKSTLLNTYVRTNRNKWDNIVWINQGNDLAFAVASNAPLRDSLRIERETDESNEDLFYRMMHRMSKFSGQNLMVVDDATADQFSMPIARYLPANENWTLLATSRNPLTGFELVDLLALEEHEAIRLFGNHHQKPISKDTQSAIIAEVGRHPLAIEMIAKTLMATRRVNPEDFLAKIKSLELDHLADLPATYVHGKEARMFGVLIETFKVLQEDFEKLDWILLRQLSVVVPQLCPIEDWEILFGVSPTESQRFDAFIAKMHQVGLISWYKKTSTTQIHRLVRDMLYYQLHPTIDDLTPMISRLNHEVFDNWHELPPVTFYRWTPYAEHLTLLMRGSTTEDLEKLNEVVGLLLNAQGRSQQAIENALYRRDKLVSEYGPRDHRIGAVRGELGDLYLKQANYRAAIEELEKAIEVDVQLFGDDDLRVIEHKLKWANGHIMAGNYTFAISQLENLKKNLIQNHGARHPLIGILDLQYGNALEETGELQKAKELYKGIVSADRAMYAPLHHSLAFSLSQLGSVLIELGEYKEAELHLKEALEIERHNFGANHPDVASAISNLARVYHHQGDFDEAIELCDQAIKIDRQFYGGDHPNLLIVLGRKADLLLETGKTDEVLELYLESIRIASMFFPSYHNAVLIRRLALGEFYIDQDETEEGVRLLGEVMEESKKFHGEHHFITAECQFRIGSMLREQGLILEARRYLEAALQTRIDIYGEYNPKTSNVMGELGLLLLEIEEIDAAMIHLERAYHIDLKILGPEHPDLAASLGNLANGYDMDDRPAEARDCFEKALSIVKNKLGDVHENFLSILKNYADFLGNIGEHMAAETILRNGLVTLKEKHGETHLLSLHFMRSLAVTLSRKPETFTEALELYKNLLALQLPLFPSAHPEIMDIMIDLMELLTDMGSTDEATKYLLISEEMISDSEEEYEATIPYIKLYSRLGEYYAESNPKLSKRYMKESYRLALGLLGEAHEYTQFLKNKPSKQKKEGNS